MASLSSSSSVKRIPFSAQLSVNVERESGCKGTGGETPTLPIFSPRVETSEFVRFIDELCTDFHGAGCGVVGGSGVKTLDAAAIAACADAPGLCAELCSTPMGFRTFMHFLASHGFKTIAHFLVEVARYRAMPLPAERAALGAALCDPSRDPTQGAVVAYFVGASQGEEVWRLCFL